MAANPQYLWQNGKLVKWEDATIHLTDLAWGAVGAVFEGIRAYTTEDGEGLNVFRLEEHMARLRDSSRMVRLPIDWNVDELVGFTLDLLRANEVHEDTYIFPLVYSGGNPVTRQPATIRTRLRPRCTSAPTQAPPTLVPTKPSEPK